MKPVFDDAGLAIEAGEIRCFYYDSLTLEYTGWSDEFIHIGVSMPGNSTGNDPGEEVTGEVAVFRNGAWVRKVDLRGEVVYSTADGIASTVDYIGDIKDGFTTLAPATHYDKWDGSQWITDVDAQHAADVAAAEQIKQNLLAAARSTISIWQTELQLGTIDDEDKASLIEWLAYIKEVQAVITSSAPHINWPTTPEG